MGAEKIALVSKTNRVSPGAAAETVPGESDRAAALAARRKGNRRMRYWLHAQARKALPKERVGKCQNQAASGHVDIRMTDRGAMVGGVMRCGSVWTCPICAAAIAEERRKQVEETIRAHLAAGGIVAMAAFTMPHSRLQSANELRGAISGAWKGMQQGAAWVRNKRAYGLLGTIRALEVTHGQGNGWHPHLHVLFFLPDLPDEQLQAFGDFLFDRWSERIRAEGYGECTRAAWRFEKTTNSERAGDYVTKWGADRELTQGHIKRAKGGGRTPWQMLEDAGRGDKAALMLFREFGLSFKGARQLTWSRGLREHYGLRKAGDDAEVLAGADKLAEEAPVIGQLPLRVWRRVLRKGWAAGVFEAAEKRHVMDDVLSFLWGVGIDPYEPPGRKSTDYSPLWSRTYVRSEHGHEARA